MRRALLIPLVAVLLLAAASVAFAFGRGVGVGQIFGAHMIRAEVVEQDGTVYDLYRGRLVAVSRTSITIREADKHLDTVPLSTATRVLGRGRRTGLLRGMSVTVVRRSGGPALIVQTGARS